MMIKVVGVRFRGAGKPGYYDPGDLEVRAGTHVIAQTARGIEYGTVAALPCMLEEESVPQPFHQLMRIATPEDEEKIRQNREKEKEAMVICREKIRAHGLDMKLIDVEYTFENNKILFYFTADGRVDFRELVKDLAGIFRTRIELRQIGVRDETKMLGGIGICGRPLCCHSFLNEFAPVSIRMAKEQNLSLNPSKISGVCGRLMCCLKNEEATYGYLNSRLPYHGELVQTSTGLHGEVSEVNVLRQTVKVLLDLDGEKELQEFPVEELTFKGKRRQYAQEGANEQGSFRRQSSAKSQREAKRQRDAKGQDDSAPMTQEIREEGKPQEGLNLNRQGDSRSARTQSGSERRKNGVGARQRSGGQRANDYRPRGQRRPRPDAEVGERSDG